MILSFLYELALWLLTISYLPKFLYDYFFKKKYKKSLSRRLGFNFPVINKGKRPLVWIHAVSVGETKAISSLTKAIRQQLNNPIIIVSNVTETGHAEAKRSIQLADYHVYLPIDLRFIITPIVKRVAPDLVILCETDFWFNFLQSAKNSGAVTAVVNGKISERSLGQFQKVSFFTKKLFSVVDVFCIQSKHYRERFKALGLDEKKMKITGNLKFDDEYPILSEEQYSLWRKQFHITDQTQIVVAGSTHEPEEKLILEQFKAVWSEFPPVKLMIVPRHPERFNEVAGYLEKENISYMRFSQLATGDKNAKVILIDAMGLLRKCYQLADVAIVAGSFTPRVGGHNILEPSSYGVPVIYGPFMHGQPELVELMEEYKAGLQVNISDLGNKIIELLRDKDMRTIVGKNGMQMLSEINGATQKTCDILKTYLEKSHSQTM